MSPVPGERDDGLQVVAGHGELRGVGLHERELLQLLLDLLLHLAFESKLRHGILEALVVAGLRIHRHSQLGLDRLQLLLQEVFPLALGDLLPELFLYLFLDLQQLLFLLDEDENVLHAGLHVVGLQDPLLLGSIDVEDGGDEIRDLARVIDVDHRQAHLLREQRVVLRDLLHLADERPRERLGLLRVEVLVLGVLHNDTDRRGLLEDLDDAEALHRRDEDVHPAVGKIDPPHDLRRRARLEEVRSAGVFHIFSLRKDEPDETIRRDGLVNGVRFPRGRKHDGRENAREDRLSAQGDDKQACGQYLVRRDDHVVAHSFFSGGFEKGTYGTTRSQAKRALP